jgi:hypothetical protein
MLKPLTPELALERASPRNAADGAGPDRMRKTGRIKEGSE